MPKCANCLEVVNVVVIDDRNRSLCYHCGKEEAERQTKADAPGVWPDWMPRGKSEVKSAAFTTFENAVRAKLTKEQNEWWDSEDAHGCFDAGWDVEETMLQIADSWEEFSKLTKEN